MTYLWLLLSVSLVLESLHQPDLGHGRYSYGDPSRIVLTWHMYNVQSEAGRFYENKVS